MLPSALPCRCWHPIGVAYSARLRADLREITTPIAGAKLFGPFPLVLWKLLSPSIDTMPEMATGIVSL